MNLSYSFYIILDGNYLELSYFESYTLLEATFRRKIEFNFQKKFETLIVKVTLDYIQIISNFQNYARLTALAKEIGLILAQFPFFIQDKISNISESFKLNFANFPLTIPSHSKFRVDLKKKGDFSLNKVNFNAEERTLVKQIIAEQFIKENGWIVDLDEPEIHIQLLLFPDSLIVGLHLIKPNRKVILKRAPSYRSYFHPASMSPYLVRSMINLGFKAGLSSFGIFLDPFMGGGGMLIEAYEQGFNTIGLEIGYWESRGGRMNLLGATEGDKGKWTIIRTDSTNIPLKNNSVDLIVTDPPYGRSTILKGIPIENLIQKVVNECSRILKPDKKMIISIPLETSTQINFNNFEILNTIQNRVHKSLTRIIYVLRKN